MRDYGTPGQIGLEASPYEYVERLVSVFREVRRVLRRDGTLWLNLGDCYHSGDRGGYRNDAHRWEKSELQRGNRGNAETIRPNRLPQPGLKDKDLVGVPWMVAFALRADGWWLRADVVWAKPNPMPESVGDRPTKSHEYLFLLSKSAAYHYDAAAIAEPMSESVRRRPDLLVFSDERPDIGGTARTNGRRGMARKNEQQSDRRRAGFNERWDGAEASGDVPELRNKRSVWTVATQAFPEAHFATMPEAVAEPCIKAGSRVGGIVLDPFGGSGTTGKVALRLNRRFILIDRNLSYCEMATRRTRMVQRELLPAPAAHAAGEAR